MSRPCARRPTSSRPQPMSPSCHTIASGRGELHQSPARLGLDCPHASEKVSRGSQAAKRSHGGIAAGTMLEFSFRVAALLVPSCWQRKL